MCPDVLEEVENKSPEKEIRLHLIFAGIVLNKTLFTCLNKAHPLFFHLCNGSLSHTTFPGASSSLVLFSDVSISGYMWFYSLAFPSMICSIFFPLVSFSLFRYFL